jgi:RNA polymerase sigma factor (sigma-70 family)
MTTPAAMTEAQMLKANEGLIYKFAMKFIRAYPNLADDILQAAKIGFLRAIRQCDTEKGSINTLAGFLVLREITDMLTSERLVSAPNHKLTEMRQAMRKLEAGETLTEKERQRVTLGLQPTSLNIPFPGAEDGADSLSLLACDEPGPAELTIQRDAAARVKNAVASLPEIQRAAIIARFWGDATLDEIAEKRDVTREAARQAVTKGLKTLGTRLALCA